MDKQHFDQLVKGVKEVKRHIAGKTVRGATAEELPAPAVCVIRELRTSAKGNLPN